MIPSNQRQSFLLEAVRGCKVMYKTKGSAPFEFDSEKSALKHIEELHLLTARNQEGDYDEDDINEDIKQELSDIKEEDEE